MPKKAADVSKKIVQKIINFIKFIPTVLGQACMWIAIIICAIVAIYLIINIISHAIAGLLGIEDSGLTNSSDYELLSQLTASGYDAVMSADELQEYYAYEYAVLMDLARNLEETGTYTPSISNTAEYDPALLTTTEWAKLCAEALSPGNVSSANKSTAKDNYGKIKKAMGNVNISANSTYAEARKQVENALSNSGAVIQDNVKDRYIDKLIKQAIAQLDSGKPSNEMTKEEVIYKSVTSDTTGETSLVPYLVIERPSKIYTYSFVDKSLANATQYPSDYSSLLRSGYTYIENNIRPLMANSTLNANNESLHKEGAPGSNSPIDLSLEYNEAIFAATKNDACVTYHIPIKVLADRFMPKAVLLSSWYMLKQDETTNEGEAKTVDKILAEIKNIYNEACLEGEIQPLDNWLLIKEVASANKTTENVVMKNIFERKDFSTNSTLAKYLYKLKEDKLLTGYNAATTLIYEKYNTDYDSREYSSTQIVQSASSPLSNQQTSTGGTNHTLLEPYNQTFGGTLKEDIVDDLELVIAHHNEVANNFMNGKQYKKAIEDFRSRLSDNVTLKTSKDINENKDKYTIYRTDEDANYLIDCDKFENQEHHHAINSNGTTHREKYNHDFGTDECYKYALNENEHADPYSSTSSVECFIPQIHVMFARVKADSRKSKDANGNTVKSDVTVKSTAVIILEGDTKYLYRVGEKELEDLAGISNNVSFMKFDRYDAQMTNIGDWKETVDGDKDNSTYFVVTDAFEAWPLKINNSSTKNVNSASYTIISTKGNGYTINDFVTKVNRRINSSLSGDSFKDSLKDKAVNGQVTAIYTGGLAVIRKGANWVDANGNFTNDALIPPVNAAPNSGIAAKYNTSQIGEATEVTDLYLNVKGISDSDKDTIRSSFNSLIRDVIVNSVASVKREDGVEIYSAGVTEEEIEAGIALPLTNGAIASSFFTANGVSFDEKDKAVIYTVEQRVTTVAQTVKQRSIPMYLPRHADTWSSEKNMKNTLEVMGEFDPTCSEEYGGYFQLVPSSEAGGGLNKINISINNEWRTEFYAKHFSKVRESDVLAMISEWETAGEDGVFAAYTYIRDLYSLIQKSKNVKDESGVPYVHKDSYTYMYIPDEILYFDESVTDKAYWLERLLATSGDDAIKQEENLTMKNRRSVKTWQVVDYEKYPECEEKNANGETIHNVYAMWPMGGYLGKSLYAFEANASKDANKKVILWGFYTGPDGHSGLDLYGRGNATRIYRNTFVNGEATIKAEYNNGNVILTDGKGNKVKTLGSSDGGLSVEGADGTAGYSNDINMTGKISGSTNLGVYTNTNVTINLDGTEVTFGGATSAVYGYELYRLTKSYRDGEKAEKILKETLEKEMVDTPLVAVAPGKVIEVNGKLRSGFVVHVEHVQGDGTDSKVKTTYAHMKRWPEVQIGEYVGAGTILGYEGTTGNSSGYHTHYSLTIDGKIGRYPIPYLYPFFTPFYYEDKASEVKYEISNEYMSLLRTIFPYGQKIDPDVLSQTLDYAIPPQSTNKQEGRINQVDSKNGEIVIKNYTPTKVLATVDQLYTADDVDENARFLEKIAADGEKKGSSSYIGDDVTALPQYFDKEFMKLVLQNKGHILKETK